MVKLTENERSIQKNCILENELKIKNPYLKNDTKYQKYF